jgi:GMP synthase-like glutamine amidotransferase
MNQHFGGKVTNVGGSFGQAGIKVDINNNLFTGLEESQKALLTHGDSVTEVAPGIF